MDIFSAFILIGKKQFFTSLLNGFSNNNDIILKIVMAEIQHPFHVYKKVQKSHFCTHNNYKIPNNLTTPVRT